MVRHLSIWSRLALLALALPLAALAEAPAAAAHDPGKMWAARMNVARPLGVSAAYDGQGRLWLARVEDRHVWVSRSDDQGRSFSNPVRVNPEPEAVAAEGENRPKIAVAADGTVHVTWTVSLAKPFTGHVRYSRSTDGGASFSPPVTVNDDRSEISHRFDALAVQGDRVVLAWLDARDRKAAEADGRKFSGSSLYYAVSTDGGANFAANRRAAQGACECCRLSIAWQDKEPVVLWRHVFPDNIRDFALIALDGNSAPRRVSDDQWHIAGCPHHGGDLAADGQGGLHLAWFTQGRTRQGLFYRRLDGERETLPLPFGDDEAQAGHPAILVQGRRVTLAWREFDGRAYGIRVMHSADRGETWSAPRQVAVSGGAADYPLLLDRAGHASLVWNTEAEGLRVLDLEGESP